MSRFIDLTIKGTSTRVIPIVADPDGNLTASVDGARDLAHRILREVDAVDPMRITIVPNGCAIPIGGGAILIVPPETTYAEIAAFAEPFNNNVDMAMCPMPKGARLVRP